MNDDKINDEMLIKKIQKLDFCHYCWWFSESLTLCVRY
jgi:hypothetical protein